MILLIVIPAVQIAVLIAAAKLRLAHPAADYVTSSALLFVSAPSSRGGYVRAGGDLFRYLWLPKLWYWQRCSRRLLRELPCVCTFLFLFRCLTLMYVCKVAFISGWWFGVCVTLSERDAILHSCMSMAFKVSLLVLWGLPCLMSSSSSSTCTCWRPVGLSCLRRKRWCIPNASFALFKMTALHRPVVDERNMGTPKHNCDEGTFVNYSE